MRYLFVVLFMILSTTGFAAPFESMYGDYLVKSCKQSNSGTVLPDLQYCQYGHFTLKPFEANGPTSTFEFKKIGIPSISFNTSTVNGGPNATYRETLGTTILVSSDYFMASSIQMKKTKSGEILLTMVTRSRLYYGISYTVEMVLQKLEPQENL